MYQQRKRYIEQERKGYRVPHSQEVTPPNLRVSIYLEALKLHLLGFCGGSIIQAWLNKSLAIWY